MEFVNNTPFPAIAWVSSDPKDQKYVSMAAKVKFRFNHADSEGYWSLSLDPEQAELCDQDLFYDKKMKLVQYESDYVPHKVQADLIVNISPNRLEFGKVGIEVKRYIPDDDGTSFQSKQLLRYMGTKRLGFVNRASASRLSYTGTTNQKWIDQRAPKLPQDFNEKYYNAADPKLQLQNEYFQAGDSIALHKLLPGIHQQSFVIPGVYLHTCLHESARQHHLLLEADTVVLDIESIDMSKNSILIVYRKRMSVSQKADKVVLDMMLEKELIEERSA